MAKEGGKLLIKYRDPVAASFSSKDIVMNVQTGTLFYKRNRKLYALRGTPDNFDLVVFPGQSTNQQILINDSSQEDGSPIMEGTDQFRFKLASATCGCANYFHIGAETLTHFSGSVRIGEHLPSTCNILDAYINPSLLVHGNMEVSASAGGIGNISASGNIEASIDLYGTNAYIHDSLIHRGNTTTKLNFGTDTINLYSDGSSIATVSSDKFTVNGSNDLFIPGTDSSPATATSVLVLDNSTGQVYKTGSYEGETFKSTGIRTGFAYIDGNVTASGNISASGKLYGGLISSSKPNVVFYNDITGELTYATSESLGIVTEVLDEGNSLTPTVTSLNFVGNAVSASNIIDDVTVTINAVTKSLWYDGQPNYISSSDNVLIDKNLGIGPWDGAYNNLEHNLHISGNYSSTDIGFKGTSGTDTSIGISQSNLVTFNILDHSGSSDTYPLKIIIGSDVNPNQPKAPNAILIQEVANQPPSFIGTQGTNIPSVSIGATGTGSSGIFHVVTDDYTMEGGEMNDEGILYNGIVVGPEYNPNTYTNQKTGSGVFIGMPSTQRPRIVGKTEPGDAWKNNTTLLIQGEQDRSVGYSANMSTLPFMEFRATDNTRQAYSASVNNTLGNRQAAGGIEDTGSMASIYGVGKKWINGSYKSTASPSILYMFKNDTMPLLNIEAQGRVGIGNFGEIHNIKALLHLKAKATESADIMLQTDNTSGSGLPGIHFRSVPYQQYLHPNSSSSNAQNGYGLFSSTVPQGSLRMFTRNNFNYSASNKLYFNQALDAIYLEAQGVEEGLREQPYPFNIKGASKNKSEGNNIQLVVGGDGTPFTTSTTSTNLLTGNNGTSALTVEAISDFRRQGEIGIGIITPSSSLHVTRSVQADNFRTTNPVDLLIQETNHSITMISGSNQLTGSNTKFLEDFKVGDAIKITGRSKIMTFTGGYTGSISTGSNLFPLPGPNFISTFNGDPAFQSIVGDLILIETGSASPTGSYHIVSSSNYTNANVGNVGARSLGFSPAYSGADFKTDNGIIHRINPHYYQIATVTGIDSHHSMSISQVWEGTSWSGSRGYKEDILFQVKTADYNPRFTVNAHGDITASGTASFGFLDITNSTIQTFKDDGVRVGDSSIDGDLTVTGTLTAQEFHTEFVSSSIIFTSGSTQFGNSSDDTHTFSGSIHVKDEGHITASGNISASGLLYASSSLGLQNIATYNSESGQYFYTSSAGLSAQLDTFKQTGVRTGNSILSGSLIIRSTGATNPGDANLTIVGGGSSADDATLSLRQNLTGAGYAVKYDGGLDHFQILGNDESDVHLSIEHTGGKVRIPGIISSSGKVYHGGLTYGTAGSLVTWDSSTGELKRQAIAGALATAIPGLLSSSNQIAADISGAIDAATGSLLSSYTFLSSSTQIASDISGSWQGQNFVSSSQTFLSTGQRNGDSAITGSLTLTTHLTASGNISASGNIFANRYYGDDGYNNYLTFNQSSSLFKVQNKTYIKFDGSSGQREVTVNEGTNDIDFVVKGESNNPLLHADANTGKIGTNGVGSPEAGVHVGGDLKVNSHITASGHISASGLLFASASEGNFSDVVVQDKTNGRFYTTSSAGLSTGLDTFKITGQRNGDSAITGSLIVTNLTASEGIYLPHDKAIFFDSVDTFIKSNTGGQEDLIIAADDDIILRPDDNLLIQVGGVTYAEFQGGETMLNMSGHIQVSGSGISSPVGLSGDSINLNNNGEITASGNISSSREVIAASAYITNITASGNISASGTLHAGLAAATPTDIAYYNTANGLFTYGPALGAAAAGTVSSSAQISADISGSWQGQEFVSASQTFLSTGVRTGDGFIDGHITASGNISSSGDITANILRLSSTTDASVSSTGHAFQAGATNSTNVIIDNNEIMARNNGALSNLHVNPDGGIITFNNSVSGDEVVIGNGNITASGNISASGTLSAGLTQASGSHIVYYNTSSGLFTHEDFNPPIDKVRFSGLNDGNTTVEDDGGSTAEFKLSGSQTLGIKVRGDSSTSTIGIELATVNIPESTDTFVHPGGSVASDDSFIVHDLSAGVVKKMIASNIPVEAFDNSTANYNTGTVTSVTTGYGLDGSISSTGTIYLAADEFGQITSMDHIGGTIADEDSFVVYDRSEGDHQRLRRIISSDIDLSQFTNDIDGTFLSVGSGNLNFTPGGTNNGVITSNGTSGATVESKLTFNGTDLRVEGGDVVAFYSSDKRLKDNVTPITNPISKIMKINGYTFDWNKKQDTYKGHDVGVIAQEVEKVLPEVVETRENGYKAVKYDKIVPLLIEGIKDQQKQIKDQQKQINELKKLIK